LPHFRPISASFGPPRLLRLPSFRIHASDAVSRTCLSPYSFTPPAAEQPATNSLQADNRAADQEDHPEKGDRIEPHVGGIGQREARPSHPGDSGR